MSGAPKEEAAAAFTVDDVKRQLGDEAKARVDEAKQPRLQAALEVLDASLSTPEIEVAKELLRQQLAPHDGTHDLVFVSEDEREATFACRRCDAPIAFVLPGLGEPAVDGKPGDRRPPADFMNHMDRCEG